MTEPAKDQQDKAYAEAAPRAFARMLATFWQELVVVGRMSRSEALEVTIAWMRATIDHGYADKEDQQ